MRCRSCKYDLRNLSENRCPECGSPFDPNDPKTFFAPARRERGWWIEIALITAVAYIVLLTLNLLDEFGVLGSPGHAGPDESLLSIIVRAAMFAIPLLPIAAVAMFLLVYLARLIVRAICYICMSRTS